MEARFAGFEIYLFAGAGGHADLQVHHAVLAEPGNRYAGVRVQLDEAIAGGHEDDPVVALAIGPVRDAAAGQLPGRDRCALAFAE